jgi:hypothetical protein
MPSEILVDKVIKAVLTAYPTLTPDALALLVVRDLEINISYWSDARCFRLVTRIREIANSEPFKFTKRTNRKLP